MSEEAIIKQLPADTQICTFGIPAKIGISMTLESVAHAVALRHAIDLAIIPLLELGAIKPVARDEPFPDGEYNADGKYIGPVGENSQH
jgi:hypothetical protein